MAKKLTVTVSRIKETDNSINAVYANIDGKECFLIRRVGDKNAYNVGDKVTVVLSEEKRTVRATGPQCSIQFNRSVNSGRSHYCIV